MPSSKTTAVPRTGLSAAPLDAPVGCEPHPKGRDFPVGPGQKYERLGDVPFESLLAGDTVRVHYRAEPYREKIMLSSVATAEAPVKLCGVAGPLGQRPIIDGQDSTTRPSLEYTYDGHQVRGLIVVGKKRSSPYAEQPSHIVIEGLEIRNADPAYSFTDKDGKKTPWAENAAGIFVQRASHVTVRGCEIHHNGNGTFIGTTGGPELTTDVLIEGNDIHENGSEGNYYQHNVYNEASGITYQFNRFRPPRSGPQGIMGANIKERSAGVVIRYNWIEDGAHIIDLVDSQESRDPNLKDPKFRETFVYGNVIVRGGTASGSMIHYGGDSGLTETYRKGTLHFFHNTVVMLNSTHQDWQGTGIFELSTNDEKLSAIGNVFFTEAPSVPRRHVAFLSARDQVVSGKATLVGNWISDDLQPLDGIPGKQPRKDASIEGFEASLRGTNPSFSNLGRLWLAPRSDSPLTQSQSAQLPAGHPLTSQYVPHGKGKPRPTERPAIGAFSVAD